MRPPPRDEQVLLRVRPHWRVLVGAVVWAMVLAALAGAAFAALEAPWDRVAIGVAAVLWLAVGARPTWRWWSTRWTLTTRRLVVRQGLFAGSRIEIPLERIADVGVTQRIGQRLLGSGTVIIELAGTTHELRDVPSPGRVQRAIADALEALAG